MNSYAMQKYCMAVMPPFIREINRQCPGLIQSYYAENGVGDMCQVYSPAWFDASWGRCIIEAYPNILDYKLMCLIIASLVSNSEFDDLLLAHQSIVSKNFAEGGLDDWLKFLPLLPDFSSMRMQIVHRPVGFQYRGRTTDVCMLQVLSRVSFDGANWGPYAEDIMRQESYDAILSNPQYAVKLFSATEEELPEPRLEIKEWSLK